MSGARARIAQYIREANVLRKSLTLSREIGQWHRDGKEIRYFFDANVVAIYSDPQSKLDHFRPMSDWISSETLKVETITIMAEFMFGGRLPGQREVPLMTPYHYEDLKSMAAGMRASAKQTVSKISEESRRKMAEMKPKIEKLEHYYNQKHLSAEQAMVELRPALGDELLIFMNSPAAEAYMLTELLKSSHNAGIVRADTRGWFHRGILKPDPNLVEEWVSRLHSVRSKKRPADQKEQRNLLNDALSLAQLVLLQREAEANVKYVLVTADNAIHAAYSRYARSERRENREPDVLHLRHPRDFVPLINLGAMSDFDQARLQVFGQIEEAVNQVLVGVPGSGDDGDSEQTEASTDVEGAMALNVESGPKAALARKEARYRERVDNLKKLWGSAASDAVTLNAQFLQHRIDAKFQWFVEALTQDDVVGAALRQIENSIGALANEHVYMVLSGVVSRYLEQVQSRRKASKIMGARRAPLLLRTNIFREIIGDTPINQYLDSLMRGGAVPLQKIAGQADNARTLFFGACVAVAAEEWESARALADSAMQRLEQAPIDADVYADAQYMQALTLRFTMKDHRDVTVARRLLDGCAQKHRMHSPAQKFEQIRAESETAALIGSFLFQQELNDSFAKTTRDEVGRLLGTADHHVDTAAGLLDELQINDPAEHDTRDMQRIGLQIFANKAALAIFKRWVLHQALRDSLGVLNHDLGDLETRIGKWSAMGKDGTSFAVPISVTVPQFVLRALLLEGTPEAREAAADALEFIGKLDYGELAPIDRTEYDFFREHLSSM